MIRQHRQQISTDLTDVCSSNKMNIINCQSSKVFVRRSYTIYVVTKPYNKFIESKLRIFFNKIYLFINYNTITNYILSIYELSTLYHVPHGVSQTTVSGGIRTHDPHANSLAHYPLDYQGPALVKMTG